MITVLSLVEAKNRGESAACAESRDGLASIPKMSTSG